MLTIGLGGFLIDALVKTATVESEQSDQDDDSKDLLDQADELVQPAFFRFVQVIKNKSKGTILINPSVMRLGTCFPN